FRSVNEVWRPDRARFSYEGLYAPDRLLAPRVRGDDGQWRETDWDVALDAAAGALRAVVDADGPGALGALASPAATTEEHYLLQALVRGLGGTNVDHRLRESDFSDQDEAPAWPWLGLALADLEGGDAALLVGSNVRKEQPLAGLRLRKAALAGASVFALNPVDHAFNFDLAGRIVVSPAEMVDELASVASAAASVAAASGAPQTPDAGGEGASKAGSRGPHREIAAALANAGRGVILLGSGALAHPHAAELRALARDLARRTGARLGCLSDGPNAAGAALAGMLPHRGPGGTPAASPGLDAAAMLDARLPGYLLLGTEPELDCANGGAALAALEAARTVVALTGYVSPAMEGYASVLLPIGLFTETPGTFYNAEGRRQRFEAVSQPPGEARPAWRILRVLANRLGIEGFDHESIDDVRAEAQTRIGEVTPPDNLAGPAPASDPAAAAAGEGTEGAASPLWRIGEVPIYAVDPIVRRAGALQQTVEAPAAAVRINPALARTLGVAAGGMATVRQNGAERVLGVEEDPAVPGGCVLLHAGVPHSAGLDPSWGPITVEPVST
ncbi:MAG: molybdopterin-dependent oxidoreductase, partial [Immundisolibacterales bacterium]|nr:molybdopterin-dependent oxidoreductase [Immundisolibacterales bacterium]